MTFSFTATAQCDACGQLLSSSDEDCDHDGRSVDAHVFRRLGEGRESLIAVETTILWKWYRLKELVEDDWIAYQWLGTKEYVNSLLTPERGIKELPHIEMSCDAPQDVTEHNNE